MLSKAAGQPDRAADVLGVFSSDVGVGVQRVAVAVQACDGDAGALEDSEVVVARGVADEDVVERRDVDRRQEASGVDLDPGEAETAITLTASGSGRSCRIAL